MEAGGGPSGPPFCFYSGSVLQTALGFEDASHCLFRRVADCGEMAHFAAGSGGVLFVEVQADTVDFERAVEARLAVGPRVAQQIRDGGGAKYACAAQRKIADGAYVLLELADNAGAFAGVIAVMRPRRKLVDEQGSILRDEDLDREDSFQLQFFRQG